MTTGHAAAALRGRLLSALPAQARSAIDAMVRAAPGAVYAVGGAPRDLLLDRPPADVDLVLERGDAAVLLRAAAPGARVIAHRRFGTARVTLASVRIDVSRARSETYVRPGALPRVAPADIDADLRRRDFSANALALRLDDAPALLDPCGGAADIAARRIRVLHEASFLDDPTRIFRAFRYSARLGFTLEARTESLLHAALPYIASLSAARVRREIELILREACAGDALSACHEAGVLRAVHPALRWDAARSEALAQAQLEGARIAGGWALLSADASPDEAEAIVARLSLTRAEAAAVRAMPPLGRASAALRRQDVRPSGVAAVLDRFPATAVAAFAGVAADPIARRLALRYLAEWRRVTPSLSGRDLQDLGVPAGPHVRRGLLLLRAARLDGWAAGRDDERALAARFARSIADAALAAPHPEVDGGE